jgi:hypothetical protein
MKKGILFSVLVLLALGMSAQQKVALQSNGTTTIFGGSSPFIDAYNAAVDGDTIYLPGAVLAPPVINKRLAIYGAGHYPDSTTATGKTILTGNLNIQEDADSLFLEGVEVTGTLSLYHAHSVNHVMISRCKVSDLNITGDLAPPSSFNTVKECVIGNMNISNAMQCVITNNIIQGKISNGNNNAIYNNIFTYSNSWYHYVLNNVDNCSISNNIFLHTQNAIHTNCELSTFTHNVFPGAPGTGSNTFTANYNNVPMAGFFIDQTGFVFDYSHDYHLADPSSYPGNAGSEVGVYGGLFSYKEGAVPSNPHFISQDIPVYTNEEGMLEVNIKVSAQDN